jgi:hypothetical protein
VSEKEIRGIEKALWELVGLLRKAFHTKPATQILILGGNMSANGLNVLAGGPPLTIQLIPLPSGSQFDSPADLDPVIDDSNASIAPHPGDLTGTLFDVSTPASDTNTVINVDATGLAGGKQISGTAQISITPASTPPPPPPNPATSIGIVAAGASPNPSFRTDFQRGSGQPGYPNLEAGQPDYLQGTEPGQPGYQQPSNQQRAASAAVAGKGRAAAK